MKQSLSFYIYLLILIYSYFIYKLYISVYLDICLFISPPPLSQFLRIFVVTHFLPIVQRWFVSLKFQVVIVKIELVNNNYNFVVISWDRPIFVLKGENLWASRSRQHKIRFWASFKKTKYLKFQGLTRHNYINFEIINEFTNKVFYIFLFILSWNVDRRVLN